MESEKSGFTNKMSEIWRKMQVKLLISNFPDSSASSGPQSPHFHGIVLTVLVCLLVYIPVGLNMRLVLFRHYDPPWTPILTAVGWLLGCLVLHCLVVGLYYRFGHNWRLETRHSEQGRAGRAVMERVAKAVGVKT